MRLGKHFDHVVGLAGLFALALSATMAAAESSETITLKVKTDDGLSESVTIDDLAVGDTDVFLTESGKEVLVTRSEDSLSMELEGRVIDVALPRVDSLPHGDHAAGHRVMVMSGDAEMLHADSDMVLLTEDVRDDGHRIVVKTLSGDGEACPDEGECRIIKRVRAHKSGDGDAHWVDEDTHATIVIGDGEAEFIDLESMDLGDGEHEVIVIEREIELHEEHDENLD